MGGADEKINVLFCCLGNICRSPMAEAVFAESVRRNNVQDKFGVIDSCGTADYHVGEEPDLRYVRYQASRYSCSTTQICRKNNVPINSLARSIDRSDFDKFDYIFGMEYVLASLADRSSNNIKNLKRIQPKGTKAQYVTLADNRVMLFSELCVVDTHPATTRRQFTIPTMYVSCAIPNRSSAIMHSRPCMINACSMCAALPRLTSRYSQAFLAALKLIPPAQL